jgi:hypothetical protein
MWQADITRKFAKIIRFNVQTNFKHYSNISNLHVTNQMYRAENIGSSSGVQSQSIHMDTKGTKSIVTT